MMAARCYRDEGMKARSGLRSAPFLPIWRASSRLFLFAIWSSGSCRSRRRRDLIARSYFTAVHENCAAGRCLMSARHFYTGVLGNARNRPPYLRFQESATRSWMESSNSTSWPNSDATLRRDKTNDPCDIHLALLANSSYRPIRSRGSAARASATMLPTATSKECVLFPTGLDPK